ncbi:hypothetical protein D3C77_614850 [compost metagenome]
MRLGDQAGLARSLAAEEALQIGREPAGPLGHAPADGAEDHVGAGRLQALDQGGQPARRGGLVVVQKGDQRRLGGGQAGVARRGHAGARRVDPDHGHGRGGAQGLDRLARTGLGVVVDDDDLAQARLHALLVEHRAQRPRQAVEPAQGGDDDGDVGRAHIASA